ncbi:Vancomycin B-type resistance protein VanW [Paenibacillus konkukensis]|uniref:Vancomycin B-type resistance protein VanW n=1 Tax=Paenibacillus konkukensis TaxID=2020716 RepID=A0ABY4RTC4_9BACL|nr:VanW family protein [Paenibacillus konkukensis]UQZ84629.1 Vancomycin B-type resistance protein VanW [Paenibacillus konkukensis]
MKKTLLKYFPFLYQWRVQQLIWNRHLRNLNPNIAYARGRRPDAFNFVCKKHKSVLRRVLANSDPILQENKIKNLNIALEHIDGIVIHPGETFSFWKLIGKTTKAKGYIEGLMLSQGEVRTGTGGGLCQLANMLFWLALHTPLEIKERHHHSFDIFPDDRRVIPFGTGTSVFYNYVDLRFYNPTHLTFQYKIMVSEEFLEGAILCNAEPERMYKVEERNHRFYQNENRWYRGNEIWRLEISRQDNKLMNERLIIRNNSEVKYMNLNFESA